VSKAVFQRLVAECRKAWCDQAEGVPLQLEFFPSTQPAFDRDKYKVIGRVPLPRKVDPPDADPNWYGFFAVVGSDDETASDRKKLQHLCRRAGAALPVAFRDALHAVFGRYAWPTDQPQDLWLTLLAYLKGASWPPVGYFQAFNPFEASLDVIEHCGLDTDNPRLPAVADDTDAAGSDSPDSASDVEEFLVSCRDLHIIAGRRAPINTIRDHLRRQRLKPHARGPRSVHLFRYSHVVEVWSSERLHESLPEEDVARERLRKSTGPQVSNS
jgi:hypothetical protein